MGFLDKFLSTFKYPELDQTSDAAMRLQRVREPLRDLLHDVKDRMEMVVGEEGTFIFIGKPPKQFGVVWVEDGQVMNLKELAAEHHLDASAMQAMIDQMRRVYERHNHESRYTATLEEREVVVHPSDAFEHEMEEIVSQLQH